MKKILILSIIALMSCVICTSCADKKGRGKDREYVTEIVEKVMAEEKNPCFDDNSDFIHYVINMRTQKAYEEVLENVPISTLEEVAVIVRNKYGNIKPYTVAKEYIENYSSVYKYMFKESSEKTKNEKTKQDTLINITKSIE